MTASVNTGSPRRQSGLAALMAILIVALVASLAVALAWESSMMLRQIENLGARAGSRELARAAAAWAAVILSEDDASVDHLRETWATALPPVEVEGSTVSGSLTDETGRFNLNALVSDGKPAAPAIDALKRMLAAQGLDASIVDSLVDWIDPDNEAGPNGAEDSYYLTLDPPYRAANRPLVDVGELRLVRGIDAQAFARIAPLTTVLPLATRINVNTAPAEVLSAFLPELDSATIVAARERQPFARDQDYLSLVPDDARARHAALITVRSSFFSARALVVRGRSRLAWRAILQRAAPGVGGQTQNSWPQIIAFHEDLL